MVDKKAMEGSEHGGEEVKMEADKQQLYPNYMPPRGVAPEARQP
jgi:hypothetical protein